jgi:hypothetical protein
MIRATHRHRALLLLVVALVAIAGIVRSAADRPRADVKLPAATASVVSAPLPAAAPARITHTEPSTVAGAAGMRIFRDPETGGIAPPNAAESAALENDSNSEDMTGLTQVTLPDGSVMIDLQGRFQESMVMQIAPNGQHVVNCTRDVKKTLSQVPVAPAQREER